MTEYPLKPRINDFYTGKSVLITGSTGFVGMVLLEALLRCCPGIEFIYLLIRGKKEMTPEARKEQLFQKMLFDQLKEKQPEVLEKVYVVPGDVVYPDLGMSEEDLRMIIKNVSIVYHSAADINFLAPLRGIIETNVYGTHNVVQLCKKLQQIDVLVYTSTICSNVNRGLVMEEEIYRLPFLSQQFIHELKNGTEESLQGLVSQCLPAWPNTYTFSKCLSENVLLENVHDVPFSVIRPSIVGNVWKSPHPGFFENTKSSSLSLASIGAGKGFIKVLLGDPKKFVDFVPVDVVANSHILAAWKVATERSPSPLIVNCSAYGSLDYIWDDFNKVLLKIIAACPFPNSFRKQTGFRVIKSRIEYRMLSFYEHFVPAYIFDILLKITGKKIRLVPLYRLFNKAMFAGEFFMSGKWTSATANFHGLQVDLAPEETKKFYTDISQLNLHDYLFDTTKGNAMFDWRKDKLTMKERLKKSEQHYILTNFIKGAFLVIMFTMLYFIASLTGKLIGF